MGIRKVNFIEGEFYHLYNRGVDKRTIYLDRLDYLRFIELLYVANCHEPVNLRTILRSHKNVYEWKRTEPLVAIGAYCLMPNHFHILATPLQSNGISTFMQKVCTSYSMYFNRKFDRSGALFEGKFKSKHVSNDAYLKYLFSYIHLNPVKLIQSDWKEVGIKNVAMAEKYLDSYFYSSYPEMLGRGRLQSVVLNSAVFPKYFESVAAANAEMQDWLTYGPDS